MSKTMIKKTKQKAAKSAASDKASVKTKKSLGKNLVLREKQTRIEILQTIADQTNLTRIQVESVFDALTKAIEAHMKKRGSGEFTIPKTGIKLRRIRKKATKARQMTSPLTGQVVTIAAKPARFAVKITALKPLKDMLEK